jgi:O-antigen/teichoic acid export membrane protein
MSRFKQKAFWIALGDFGGRGFSFLTSIYLARTLGADYFGMITVAVSILGYATWGADLGVLNIGVREIAKEPKFRIFRSKEIFNLKIALAAFVLLISTITLSYIPIGALQKQVILGYLYSLIPYALLLDWYYSGEQKFGKLALSRIINGAVYFSLVYLLISSESDVTMVPILYTIGVTSAVVVLGTFSITDKPFVLASRGFKKYLELLKSSSIVGLGDFFAKIVQLLPPILIGIFLSLKDAGLYGAAFRVIIIAMMLDRIFVNLLLPNLSSLWVSNKKNAVERLSMVYRLVVVGGTIVSLLTAINAKQIILTLYGSEFVNSIPILQILSLFILLTFINSLFSFGLIATNNDKKFFLATSFGGIISALMIVLFSSLGDSYLVALSVVLSEFVLATSSYFWFRNIASFKVLRIIIIITVIASVIFSSFYYFDINPLIASLITLIVIPLISWYTRIIRIGELNWLKEKLIR